MTGTQIPAGRSDSLRFEATLDAALEDCHLAARGALGVGRVSSQIPALGMCNPEGLGLAVATVGGAVSGAGDSDEAFSIQSISKVFALSLALAKDGERIWSRIGQKPSGRGFNALLQLEHDGGLPPNPFLNAGALLVTDVLITLYGTAVGAVVELVRHEAGRTDVTINHDVAASELASCHRNFAIGHYLADFGMLEHRVDDVMEEYVRQCSISASCKDIARSLRFLANDGIGNDGSRVLESAATRRVNALMTTCGLYDASTEFAYRVGLPGKSGVSGGVVAVAPGAFTACAWSPRVDVSGTSVAGVTALERLASHLRDARSGER